MSGDLRACFSMGHFDKCDEHVDPYVAVTSSRNSALCSSCFHILLSILSKINTLLKLECFVSIFVVQIFSAWICLNDIAKCP